MTLPAPLPSPDPELFDAPWPQREAVYLEASRHLPFEHLEPLSALVWLDDQAPRRELLARMRAAFDPMLSELLSPYLPVFDGLDNAVPRREHLALAHQVVDRFIRRSEGDPFAPVHVLPPTEAAAALAEVAQLREIEFDRRPMIRLVQRKEPLAAALLDGLLQTERLLRSGHAARVGPTALSNVPFHHLVLHRCAQGRESWRPLRAMCETPLAILACRLDALAGEGELSEHDFLPRIRRRSPFTSRELKLPTDSKLPLALRWLLQRPLRWFEGESYERERISSAFVEATIAACRGARPRPLEPEERALLQAIQEAPEDDAPRLVHADWHEQRGTSRQLAKLLVALHLRPLQKRDTAISAAHAAIVLAHLGDPAGVPLLIEAFGPQERLRLPILTALWALGPLPPSERLALPEAPLAPALEWYALRAVLAPDEPEWSEALLEGLPAGIQRLGDRSWAWEGPVRLAFFVLLQLGERDEALASRVGEIGVRFAWELSRWAFGKELERCREWHARAQR